MVGPWNPVHLLVKIVQVCSEGKNCRYSNMVDAQIKQLVELLEEEMNWGQARDWKTDDFESLREEIHAKTGVYLSVTTLKRLVGKVEYEGNPTLTTLNAMAVFLNYQSWREFQQERSSKTENGGKLKAIQFNMARKFFVAGALAMLSIFLVFSFVDLPTERINPEDVTFEIERVTTGLPNTVIFRYDVSNVDANKVEIQQDWDPTKRHRADPSKQVFTHFYEFPGYYNAKLLVNGQVLHTRDLYIPSNGWLAALSSKNQPPRYLLGTEWVSSEKLAVKDAALGRLGLGEEEIVLNYYNAIDAPQQSFENFEFKARLRFNSEVGNNPCEYRRIVFLGSKMSMRVPISYKGCVAQNKLRLGNLFVDGKTNDLSPLGVDLGELVDVHITNVNNLLTIQIGSNEVLSYQLQDDFGNLGGVQLAFHGMGEVSQLMLTAEDATLFELN